MATLFSAATPLPRSLLCLFGGASAQLQRYSPVPLNAHAANIYTFQRARAALRQWPPTRKI